MDYIIKDIESQGEANIHMMAAGQWSERAYYLANTHSAFYPWESAVNITKSNAIQDLDIIESTQPFVEQIQARVKELESNLTVVSNEFDAALALASESDWNSSALYTSWHSLHENYTVASFNYSLVSPSFYITT